MGDSSESEKLGLFDSIGMAVGGMVGGGIFSVLGVAVQQSGNAAFLSFGVAGLLALITGISYARLTCSFDEAGGSFSYLEHIIGPRTSGTVSWFLILGYVFTISLYSFTFGRYLSQIVFPGAGWLKPVLGGGIILVLTGLNLVGVRESGWVEDVMVYGKIFILGLLVAAGLFVVDSEQSLPVMEEGVTTIVGTAAILCRV